MEETFNSGGSVNYRDIVDLSAGEGYVIDNWDEEGSVPYVTKNGVFYCGYDNPRSIAAKGTWLLGLGMKGMMFWVTMVMITREHYAMHSGMP